MSNTQNCYNSVSCILSVLIIIFVLGSIVWDMCVTKPAMRESIDEIKVEIRNINEKIDTQVAKDSAKTYAICADSATIAE